MIIAAVNPDTGAVNHNGETFTAVAPGLFDVPEAVVRELLTMPTQFRPATDEDRERVPVVKPAGVAATATTRGPYKRKT